MLHSNVVRVAAFVVCTAVPSAAFVLPMASTTLRQGVPADVAAEAAVVTENMVPRPRIISSEVTRRGLFVLTSAAALGAVVPVAAQARGRGTQPAVYQRYAPRIVAYGEYLKSDLPALIDAADWPALKAAVAADVATKKGKVGPLYNGESAMSLWASTYSETAITPKTKNMEEMVAVVRSSRLALETVALKGTGEGLKKEGGFFGIGAKTEAPPSTADLKKRAGVALKEAKEAYNAYVEINNAGIPFEINPLPTI